MVDKVKAEKPIVTEHVVTLQQMTTHPQSTTFHACVGFTLVELIIVMAIVAILALMSLPLFNDYVRSARNKRCISELRTIDQAITAYILDKNALPGALSDVGMGGMMDPWNHLYVYALPAALEYPVTGKLNNDYDLYSMGSDGVSAPEFAGLGSPDDLVRVNNGSTFCVRDDL